LNPRPSGYEPSRKFNEATVFGHPTVVSAQLPSRSVEGILSRVPRDDRGAEYYMKSFPILALLVILSVSAQAHGSQGYAPDSYCRILAPTWAIETSTKTKFKLPIGCVIHVLYFETSKAIFELSNDTIGTLPALKLFEEDYLGEGNFITRPF
jgi:hypothetical protein